jgi:LysR family transcriptional regulator, regulator for genes of the gallate degradation pathway
MDMDVRHLERFIDIVESGSLGKSARRLNISQPALTKTIHQLETRLGTRLLDRGPRGVTPTVMGDALYARAKIVAAELRSLADELDALRGGSQGRVAVGVTPGPGVLSRVMPAATTNIARTRPGLAINMISGAPDQLLPALRLGDLDFLITVIDDGIEMADLEQEPLFRDRIALVVRQGHPLAARAIVGFADLARHRWIMTAEASQVCRQLDALARETGRCRADAEIASNSTLFVKSTLTQSDFIGFLPHDAIQPEDGNGQLVEIELDPAEMTRLPRSLDRPIGIVYRQAVSLSPASRAMIGEIRAVCSRLGYSLP